MEQAERHMSQGPSRFSVVIPARNEEDLIGETLTAISGIAALVSIIVVDDASTDRTADIAREHRAVVESRPRSTGKADALMAGIERALAESADDCGLLLLDADVGDSAADIPTLLAPIATGELDLAIAIYVARGQVGGRGRVVRLARRGIERRTGWSPSTPLSGIRAMTREAYAAVRPLARGWGVEAAMTIDALQAGLRVGEVDTTMTHRATGASVSPQLHRARQYRDVWRALRGRRVMPGGH
jgi:glycosyltransferase involved in cell wall biosynthesis